MLWNLALQGSYQKMRYSRRIQTGTLSFPPEFNPFVHLAALWCLRQVYLHILGCLEVTNQISAQTLHIMEHPRFKIHVCELVLRINRLLCIKCIYTQYIYIYTYIAFLNVPSSITTVKVGLQSCLDSWLWWRWFKTLALPFLKWTWIQALKELNQNSPEICLLKVGSKTLSLKQSQSRYD